MFTWIITQLFWLNYYLFFNLKFFIFYNVLNLSVSALLYFNLKKYYEPCTVTNNEGKKVKLEELYPEFHRYESKKSFTFLRIFFGFTFLVWWRIFVFINVCCIWYSLALR